MQTQRETASRARKKLAWLLLAVALACGYELGVVAVRAEEPTIERLVGTKRLPPWTPKSVKSVTPEQAKPELIEVLPAEVVVPVEPAAEPMENPGQFMEYPKEEPKPSTPSAAKAESAATPTDGAQPASSTVATEPTGRLDGSQFAILLVGVIASPLVALLGLFFLVRKCGVPFGPLFRVEVAQPPSTWAGSDVGSFRIETMRVQTVPSDNVPADEGGVSHFDLGPSYAEERRMKEEALKDQELAMLQHIVDQNLQLRDEISQFDERTSS